MTSRFYTDPADRFAKAVAATRSARQPVPGTVQPAILESVIRSASNGGVATKVAEHVALHSGLTEAEAQQIVTPVLTATSASDPSTQAQAVSDAVNTAISASGDVSLSDPVMLGPVPRFISSAALVALAFLSVVLASTRGSGTATTEYVALVIAAVLSIIGALVLIMGYRSVTISGSVQ